MFQEEKNISKEEMNKCCVVTEMLGLEVGGEPENAGGEDRPEAWTQTVEGFEKLSRVFLKRREESTCIQ